MLARVLLLLLNSWSKQFICIHLLASRNKNALKAKKEESHSIAKQNSTGAQSMHNQRENRMHQIKLMVPFECIAFAARPWPFKHIATHFPLCIITTTNNIHTIHTYSPKKSRILDFRIVTRNVIESWEPWRWNHTESQSVCCVDFHTTNWIIANAGELESSKFHTHSILLNSQWSEWILLNIRDCLSTGARRNFQFCHVFHSSSSSSFMLAPCLQWKCVHSVV